MTVARDPPRVSVIVRTKDRPGLLAEALESLRRQTFSGFETVIVNDGSALPPSCLGSPPGLDLRIIVPEPPGGRTRGLNAGLRAAKGRYVSYLDDDDLYLPAHLETLVRFLDGSDEYGAAYTAVDQVTQRLRPNGCYEAGERLITYGRPFDPHRILFKNDIPLIALMHRRDLVEKAGPFDDSFDLFEDWDFLIRLSRVTRIRFLAETTALYRLRDNGSNATTAAAWHSAKAEAARKALFLKHARLRGPEAQMALVDGFDDDLRDLLRRVDAAEERCARLEDDLRTERAGAREREAALAAERDELARHLTAVHRSLWWRLATPWWRLKEHFRR